MRLPVGVGTYRLAVFLLYFYFMFFLLALRVVDRQLSFRLGTKKWVWSSAAVAQPSKTYSHATESISTFPKRQLPGRTLLRALCR